VTHPVLLLWNKSNPDCHVVDLAFWWKTQMASNQVPVNCVGVTGTHAGLRLQIAANQQSTRLTMMLGLVKRLAKRNGENRKDAE